MSDDCLAQIKADLTEAFAKQIPREQLSVDKLFGDLVWAASHLQTAREVIADLSRERDELLRRLEPPPTFVRDPTPPAVMDFQIPRIWKCERKDVRHWWWDPDKDSWYFCPENLRNGDIFVPGKFDKPTEEPRSHLRECRKIDWR